MPPSTVTAHDEAQSATGAVEGARVAALVSSEPDMEFFVTDVACGDEPPAVEAASAAFADRMPNTGVVMLSAGARRLVVHARVPASRATNAGCAYRLVAEALMDVPYVQEEGATDIAATAVVWKDESCGRDPFGDKDIARTAVAEYMQEAGLFGDSEDEEEEEASVKPFYGEGYAKMLERVRDGAIEGAKGD